MAAPRKDSCSLNAALSSRRTPASLECAILAHGALQVPTDQVAALRRNPGKITGKEFSPALLRFADEQTVVGVATVLQAIERHGLSETDFTNWGILGSPIFLGRSTVVQAILRFRKEGAWGVSPHIIPHRLLHAVSGTVSQVLGIHGPNYGVGGGPDGLSEALLTAFTLITSDNLPGLWLLLTGHDPEPVLDAQGQITSPGACQAVALALSRTASDRQQRRLCLTPYSDEKRAFTEASLVSLPALRAALEATSPASVPLWRLDGFGTMSMMRQGVQPRLAA